MADSAKRTLPDELLAAFCRDTALLLDANIPLHLGYADIYEDGAADARLSRAAQSVTAETGAGARLSEALERSGAFPKHLCDMTRTGEQAGRLDDVMRQLAAYYERNAAFRNRLAGALVYPVILIGMMTVVVAVLLFTVLPVFADVLAQFDQAAAAGTDAVLRSSRVVCIVILALLALSILIGGAALLLSRSRKGAALLRHLLAGFGPTKKILCDMAASDFAAGFAALIASGFSAEESIEALVPAIEHPRVRERAQTALEALRRGEGQSRALIGSGLFGPMDNHLIAVAVRTGTLDAASDSLAQRCDEKVADTLERAAALVEPVLIACLTLVIGAVMLSVMLPLIRILSSIG